MKNYILKFLELYVISFLPFSFRNKWYKNYIWGKNIDFDILILSDVGLLWERLRSMTKEEKELFFSFGEKQLKEGKFSGSIHILIKGFKSIFEKQNETIIWPYILMPIIYSIKNNIFIIISIPLFLFLIYTNHSLEILIAVIFGFTIVVWGARQYKGFINALKK